MAEKQSMLAKLAPFLLGGGAGLLASRGQIEGLGPGILQGGEIAQQQLLNKMRLEQEERAKIEQAQKDEQLARERAIGQSAPENIRAIATAFPEAYASQQLKAPDGPQSGVGKLANDLARGLITKADYDASIKKLTYIAPTEGVGGPFAGSGMTAQSANYYLKLEEKRARGEPLTPAEQRLYNVAKRQMEAPVIVQGPDGINYIVPRSPLADQGGPREAVPGVTPKLTDEQAKSAGYYERALQSDSIITKVEPDSSEVGVAAKRMGESFPLAGLVLGAGVNAMLSGESQSMQQAQDDFLAAILRKESGATITTSERMDGARQYFPQPFDKPEVLEQKRANRETKINALKREAGPWEPEPSTQTEAPADGWSVRPK